MNDCTCWGIEMMMPDYLTNQLIFFSNARFILDFIKAKTAGGDAPPQFSLSAIKKMPESLYLPMNEPIRQLAILNMEIPPLPPLDEAVKQVAVSAVFSGQHGRASESAIGEAIDATRAALIEAECRKASVKAAGLNPTILEVFEQAVANYHHHQFFCQYDWRFTNWGTVEDIHSVVESTFELPTGHIEFKTKWTPPIPALEALAGFFPSVRFELKYQYAPSDVWKKVEIFPNPPFSY
jgi:hypothetical protein